MQSLTDKVFLVFPSDISDDGIWVNVKYQWVNDGIGWYEFWGSQCYDAGQSYPDIEEISIIEDSRPPEELKDIKDYIDNNFEECCRAIEKDLKQE